MKEIYDFLKNAGTYFLATIEDGKPRVRPFGTIDLYKNKLTIQTGLSKNVAKQMLDNPDIEICALDGNKWIRIEAKVKVSDDKDLVAHILDEYPSLKSVYKVGDGNTCVFILTSGVATIHSFTEAPKVIKF